MRLRYAQPSELSNVDQFCHFVGSVAVILALTKAVLMLVEFILHVRMCYQVGKEKLLEDPKGAADE